MDELEFVKRWVLANSDNDDFECGDEIDKAKAAYRMILKEFKIRE